MLTLLWIVCLKLHAEATLGTTVSRGISLVDYVQDKFGSDWEYPCSSDSIGATLPFCNLSLSFEQRAYDLIYNELNLTELVSITGNSASKVSSIGLSSYQWNNCAIHGCCTAPGVTYSGKIKNTTMFPQVIGTAATFNRTLWYMIGDVTSTEARVMNNYMQAGLTYWSPNINIFRDPRWGRGQETPGEDPFITSQYAKHFVLGMQGTDDTYLKVSAQCKHYAVYNLENYDGKTRHNFNAITSEFDLNETYLVPFKYCVIEGNASSIMCSYNAVNGIPSCANKWLLTDIARDTWKFNGYIASDCGAVGDVASQHHYTSNSSQTDVVVYQAGMDIECGNVISSTALKAIESGELTKSSMQQALYRAAIVQFRLGMYDPPDNIPWVCNIYCTPNAFILHDSFVCCLEMNVFCFCNRCDVKNKKKTPQLQTSLNKSNVLSAEHLQLSLDATRQSIVLLKNLDNFLPIKASDYSKIALIGPNADNTAVMKGNYANTPPFIYSVYDGLTESYFSKSQVTYELGCQINSNSTSGFGAAISAAQSSDLTILVIGINTSIEGENHDRYSIGLPGAQSQLVEQVCNVSKKCIVVVLSGGCVDVSQFSDSKNEKVNAMLWGGYPGMYGGLAIADIIFGTFNPIGRLTQTWYKADYVNQVNMFDMGMRPNGTYNAGRGYRYYNGSNINFEFGFGLGYTTFKCSNVDTSKIDSDNSVVSVNVTNTGNVNSGGVVLVYWVPTNAGVDGTEIKRLIAFDQFYNLASNENTQMTMNVYKEFLNYDEFKQNKGTYVAGGVC